MKKIVLLLVSVLISQSCLPMEEIKSKSAVKSQEVKQDHKVFIDTDLGNDDWMALLEIMRDKKATILGITMAGNGIAKNPEALDNVARLQHIAESTDEIPLGSGPNSTNDDENPYPDSFRETSTALYGIDVKKIRPNEIENDNPRFVALELIEKVMAKQADKSVTYLSLGSLTNLSQAISKSPWIKDKIAKVVVMGGSVRIPSGKTSKGNVSFFSTTAKDNAVAEFNILSDPVAAKNVFNQASTGKNGAFEIRLVSLDSTRSVPITVDTVKKIQTSLENEDHPTPALKFVEQVLLHDIDRIKAGGRFYAWDPLAAFLALYPEQTEWTKVQLSVNAIKGNEYGDTYEDNENGKSIFVAEPLHNPDSWLQYFIETLQN